MKVLGFGEIIWDIYPDNKQTIGGAMFNFCAHMAHLGDETYLISAVGRDRFGFDAGQELIRHGVSKIFLQKNRYETGKCIVTLNEKKVPQFDVLSDVSYDHIRFDSMILNKINAIEPDLFVFNTLIQRAPASRAALGYTLARASFPEIFCDVNIREGCYDADSLRLCLSRATVIKISADEGHVVYDLGLAEEKQGRSLAEAIAEKYPNIKAVVYTLGAEGSEVYDAKTGVTYSSGKPEQVKVVSTVGAGDCYGATFCHEYFSGKTIPEAIKSATERANIVVSNLEAIPF
jgi:fructokinase